MAGKKATRCVLCGDVIRGYGNNPYPLYKRGRCCNSCDGMFVTPVRIALMSAPTQEAYEEAAKRMRIRIKRGLAS